MVCSYLSLGSIGQGGLELSDNVLIGLIVFHHLKVSLALEYAPSPHLFLLALLVGELRRGKYLILDAYVQQPVDLQFLTSLVHAN